MCGACWDQLFAFHNFYLSVEQAHKQLLGNQIPIGKDAELNVDKEIAAIAAEVEVVINENVVKQENVLGESVAATVKRRRGRPRKQLPLKVQQVLTAVSLKPCWNRSIWMRLR